MWTDSSVVSTCCPQTLAQSPRCVVRLVRGPSTVGMLVALQSADLGQKRRESTVYATMEPRGLLGAGTPSVLIVSTSSVLTVLLQAVPRPRPRGPASFLRTSSPWVSGGLPSRSWSRPESPRGSPARQGSLWRRSVRSDSVPSSGPQARTRWCGVYTPPCVGPTAPSLHAGAAATPVGISARP